MRTMQRKGFQRGWVPSADWLAASGTDLLLRMDNLVLDDLGSLVPRQGITSLYTLPGADVAHSLFNTKIGDTLYRMAGGASTVYANGSSIATSIAGSGDIIFGSYLGQIFFTRSTTHKKYDGSTVRTWGIPKPNDPTVVPGTSNSALFSNCGTGEFTAIVGSLAQCTGYDGTPNGAFELTPVTTPLVGAQARHTYGTDQDFSKYGSISGTDDDVFWIWVYIPDPTQVFNIWVTIYCNTVGSGDMYHFLWTAYYLREVLYVIPGWNHLKITRSQFIRYGNTSGKNWSTIKAIDVGFTLNNAGTALKYDDIRIVGGGDQPCTGIYKWVVVPIYNNTKYNAIGNPSNPTPDTSLEMQGAVVSIDSTGLESSVNELWLYRTGGSLNDYYRVAVKTGGPFVGTVNITDGMSDADALALNIKLQLANDAPPNDIIDLAGPYYFRLFALTEKYLYPSRRLNPDSFSAEQAIQIGGETEKNLWVATTTNGIYIGTTKDIYFLDGDGAEMADGTINFTLRNCNVGNPPISKAKTQDGNTIYYLAADGWRPFNGVTAGDPITMDLDLLYKGQTRYGISPVNLSTGRFVAVVSKGILTIVTPEGADVYSGVLHRYDLRKQRWYRHLLGSGTWRGLAVDPDGTLIGADSTSVISKLDTGTLDGASKIPITIWTAADDDSLPAQRKEAFDFQSRIITGSDTISCAIHCDAGASANKTLSIVQADSEPALYQTKIDDLPAFRRLQLRFTGSVASNAFKLRDFLITYQEQPAILTYWRVDLGNLTKGEEMLWLRRIAIKVNAPGNLTVTPYFGDTAKTAKTIAVTANKTDIYSSDVLDRSYSGHGLELAFTCATGAFEPFWVEVVYRLSGRATQKHRVMAQPTKE